MFNKKYNTFYWTDHCHKLWLCKFLLSTLRTSSVNRNASNIGRRFNNAVSEVSENHDFIGIALSEKNKNKIIILFLLFPHIPNYMGFGHPNCISFIKYDLSPFCVHKPISYLFQFHLLISSTVLLIFSPISSIFIFTTP